MANTFKQNKWCNAYFGWNSTYSLHSTKSTTTVVIGLVLCNIHTTSVTADVQLVSDTSDTETNETVLLAKDVTIPAGSSLELLTGGKVVVQATDIIKIDCSVSAKIDATLSILEIT